VLHQVSPPSRRFALPRIQAAASRARAAPRAAKLRGHGAEGALYKAPPRSTRIRPPTSRWTTWNEASSARSLRRSA
jgi:hypothetical protein